MPSSTTSLHSLSVQNPNFQLHPLFWTSYHTSIVNCVFQQFEDDNPDSTAPTTFVYHPDFDTEGDARRLATALVPREKFVWVESTFNRPGSPITQIRESPSFSYHKHPVNYTCTELHPFRIRKEQVVNHGDPIIGYYRYNTSKERRQSLTPRQAPRGSTNSPVKRLYDIRYRRITPPDWRRDPYLFSFILSLAQLHRRNGTVSLSADIQTRLLVTHMSDSTYAYVYKADIPQQLLECLDNPKRPMDDFAFPNVAWIRIPFEPYSIFADRLQSHLVCAGFKPIPTSLGGKKRKYD